MKKESMKYLKKIIFFIIIIILIVVVFANFILSTSYNSGVKVNYPFEYTLIQRINSTSGIIFINGSSQNATTIEANFNNEGWKTINTSFSDSFTGSLIGKIGNGTLIVRDFDNPQDNFTINNLAIGDLIWITGQSNGAMRGEVFTNISSDLSYPAYVYLENDTARIADDPIDMIAPPNIIMKNGSAYPLIANTVIPLTNIPISFIPTAQGGTAISTWLPKTGQNYNRAVNQINEYTHNNRSVGIVIWAQGEANIEDGYISYKSNLEDVLNDFIENESADYISVLMINHRKINTWTRNTWTRENVDNIRKAQKDVCDKNTKISCIPTYDINLTKDRVHYVHYMAPEEIDAVGLRYSYSILEHYYGLDVDGTPPIIESILLVNSTRLQLRFNESSNLIISDYLGNTSTLAKGFRIYFNRTNYTDTNISATTINGINVFVDLKFELNNSATITYGSFYDGYGRPVLRDTSNASYPVMVFYNMNISDATPPQLTNIQATSITTSSAIINWDTNESANSSVYYGIISNETNSLASSTTFLINHSLSLSSLTPSTTYYFNVSSCNVVELCNTSIQYTFITSAQDNGGSSGGSGGSSIKYYKCEKWKAWSICNNNQQTRNCFKKIQTTSSSQGVILSKFNETETKACTNPVLTSLTGSATEESGDNNTNQEIEKELTQENKSFGASITGAVTGFSKTKGGKFFLIVFGVLALGWILLAVGRKIKKK